MPGFTTHYLFGVDIYRTQTNTHLKKIIQSCPSAYTLGLQGPDIFFYHLPFLLGDDSKKIGSIMHKSKVNDFFKNYLLAMGSLLDREREIALSYFAGFLCHYYLDTTTHPYIYSQSKIYDIGGILADGDIVPPKDKMLYYAEHRTLETAIDTLMLKEQKDLLPSQFLKERVLKLPREVSHTLAHLLSQSINKTYYKEEVLSYRHLNHIFHDAKWECKILKDHTGHKKKWIEKLENRYIKFPLLSSMIPSDSFFDKEDILNISHKTWCYPWDTKSSFSSSFIELYHIASEKCIETLHSFWDYIDIPSDSMAAPAKQNIFLEKAGNLSYHTGQPLSIC